MSVTSYDLLPYRSIPFPQSHPDRLATIGTLMGMSPIAVDRCHVLELGCAAGGNLIPLAEQFPHSEFLGIDASYRQIEDGRLVIESLGLRNIELRVQDILDFPQSGHPFDYIISHGVFSWVPAIVRDRILELCQSRLSPDGIAYISYNTYPGWHMRGLIRGLMQYRARDFDSPNSQVLHARELLAFLSNSVSADGSAYGMLLKKELAALSRSDDSYLFHEFLEKDNSPLYFHQFAQQAERAELQYLGEAVYGMMSIENFPIAIRTALHSMARNLTDTEQYMDFLRNRAFRQTLLCHRNVVLDRTLPSRRMSSLRVASNAVPQAERVDFTSGTATQFLRGTTAMTTTNPFLKSAMLHLRSIWPSSVPFVELASIATSMVTGHATDAETGNHSGAFQELADVLIRSYATSSIDLHTVGYGVTHHVSSHPRVSRLSLLQATRATAITNRLHRIVSLNDEQRRIVTLLNGTRNYEQLVDCLAEMIVRGDLVVHEGPQNFNTADAHTLATKRLPLILQSLADEALLIEA